MPCSATLLEEMGFDVPRISDIEEEFDLMMNDTCLNTVFSQTRCGSMSEKELGLLATLDKAYFDLWVKDDIEAALEDLSS